MKKLIYFIFSVITWNVGYNIHGSMFWATMNFFFAPISWLKWLICHDVTWNIIQQSFTLFFK